MKKLNEEKKIKGYKSKRAGTSFEYRVRNYFNNLENWEAERNILSGGAGQIIRNIAKHDVRAYNSELNIFIQIECKKKTGIGKDGNKISIKKEWINGLNFKNDEILCFACDHSDIYVLTEFSIFKEYYNNKAIDIVKYNSNESFTIKIDEIKDTDKILECFDNIYIILRIDKYINLREDIERKKENTIEGMIKKIKTIEDFKNFENKYFDKLNLQQKKLLYIIGSQIEDNIINNLNNIKLNNKNKKLITCPHCKKIITTNDIKEQLDKELKGVKYDIF